MEYRSSVLESLLYIKLKMKNGRERMITLEELEHPAEKGGQ